MCRRNISRWTWIQGDDQCVVLQKVIIFGVCNGHNRLTQIPKHSEVKYYVVKLAVQVHLVTSPEGASQSPELHHPVIQISITDS